MLKDNDFYNRVNAVRIESRQIDELIGVARGLLADRKIDQSEIEFLQKWLTANIDISTQPLIRTLYQRIGETLRDGIVDANESSDLFDTLNHFVHDDFELGESLKATSLPLNDPEPDLDFLGYRYCFTGTFTFGKRKQCEEAIIDRGGTAGSLTQKTNFLVVGTYATDSWKHSSFGTKILTACDWLQPRYPHCNYFGGSLAAISLGTGSTLLMVLPEWIEHSTLHYKSTLGRRHPTGFLQLGQSPATFIGYNSLNFDEVPFRRWQRKPIYWPPLARPDR
jgi:hypothetical protein